MVSSVTKPQNFQPKNVPNQMGQEWFLRVKQSIEEAIQAGACKKMDFDYSLLPFVSTKAASSNAIGHYCRPAYDADGVFIPYVQPTKLNIAG